MYQNAAMSLMLRLFIFWAFRFLCRGALYVAIFFGLPLLRFGNPKKDFHCHR